MMRRAPGGAERGFTLAELLVSLGIVSVITGIAVGMIRRGDGGLGAEANARLIRSTLRYARNAARDAGAGALVTFDPQTREVLVAPVELAGNFHFEDDRGPGNRRYAYGGQLVDDGRLGRALALAGDEADLGRIGLVPRNGFRATVWVRPGEKLAAGRILERENAFVLKVGAEGQLSGTVRVGPQGEAITLTTRPGLLAPGRWTEAEIVYDRLRIELRAGGVTYARQDETRPVFDDPKGRLLVGGAGFAGTLDTLRYWMTGDGERRRLGASVEIDAPGPVSVRFDGDGRLNPSAHDALPCCGCSAIRRTPRRAPIVRVETSGVVR
ncbi:MAG: prepilin-type N-terminal cleavage/methylation domain-containing protein [Planctomycetota bacterium]